MADLENKTPEELQEMVFGRHPWLFEILNAVKDLDDYAEGEIVFSKRAGKITKLQFRMGKTWLADKR